MYLFQYNNKFVSGNDMYHIKQGNSISDLAYKEHPWKPTLNWEKGITGDKLIFLFLPKI